MPCYQNGKVYKIVNDVDDKIYIGSTCNPLYKRLYGHKSRGKGWQPEFTFYHHLNKVGWDNVRIILIENYPCKTMDELRARERYHYDQVPPHLRLNSIRPKITEQELIDRRNAKEKREAELEAKFQQSLVKNECECGASVRGLSAHFKTQRHQRWQKVYDFIVS